MAGIELDQIYANGVYPDDGNGDWAFTDVELKLEDADNGNYSVLMGNQFSREITDEVEIDLVHIGDVNDFRMDKLSRTEDTEIKIWVVPRQKDDECELILYLEKRLTTTLIAIRKSSHAPSNT